MFWKKIVLTCSVAVISAATAGILAPAAYADKAGAFIGGVMAAKIGQNMRERTRAEQQQAYYAQQQAQAAQQARSAPQAAPAPQQQSPQQRLDQLDKLAAGGYITPDEYKAKKQQILDSM